MAYLVPSGSKLTTWYPDGHPLKGQEQNYQGLLVERPVPKRFKRYMTISGEDAQEAAAHRVVPYIVKELLSGSTLSRRLLGRLSICFMPNTAQQAVNDGYSRYGEDCPMPGSENVNSQLNGLSEIARMVADVARDNWLYDPAEPHPDPSNGVFATATFHCSNPNVVGELNSSINLNVDPHVTTPYGYVSFPGMSTAQGAAVFNSGDLVTGVGGFSKVAWKEFYDSIIDDTTTGGSGIFGGGSGGSSFYLELPWRSPGHDASYWWDDEATENVALAFLNGLAAIIGWDLLADPITVSADSAPISTAVGQKGVQVAVPTVDCTASTQATATTTRSASAGLTGAAAISLTTAAAHFETTALTAAGPTVATAKKTASTSTALTATAAVTATGVVGEDTTKSGVSVITAAGVTSATAKKTTSTAAALTGAAIITATAIATVPPSAGQAFLTGAGTVSAQARKTAVAGTSVTGTGVFTFLPPKLKLMAFDGSQFVAAPFRVWNGTAYE